MLPDLEIAAGDMDAKEMLNRAIELARTGEPLDVHPLLGRLPLAYTMPQGLADKLRRSFGRMPWTTTQKRLPRPYSVPVGGDGGVRNPESAATEPAAGQRPRHHPGAPARHSVSRMERVDEELHAGPRRGARARTTPAALVNRRRSSADLRKWFEEHTHRAMTSRLEDGSDLDVDQYVSHYIDLTTGEATEPRIFRELLPSSRDVTTALLLDGSSSLGVHGGRIFKLELACADALSQAMTLARERHGIFVFTGNTRHRVEVSCLKDFEDRRFVPPSGARPGHRRIHQARRALAPPDEPASGAAVRAAPADRHRRRPDLRRGLRGPLRMGRRGARRRGGQRCRRRPIYYVGVGPTRVDPLPEVFGPRRSQRIRRVEELPRVLAHVHRELVAA